MKVYMRSWIKQKEREVSINQPRTREMKSRDLEKYKMHHTRLPKCSLERLRLKKGGRTNLINYITKTQLEVQNWSTQSYLVSSTNYILWQNHRISVKNVLRNENKKLVGPNDIEQKFGSVQEKRNRIAKLFNILKTESISSGQK